MSSPAIQSGYDLALPALKTLTLRDYQIESVDKLRNGLRLGHKRQILSLATGAGKTEIAANLILAGRQKNSRMLFIADRLALVDQASDRLSGYGIPHGRIQGSNTAGRYMPVQVASAQTIEKWDDWGDFDVVIIDEAHNMRSRIIDYIIKNKIPTIGLTATPLTKGIGDIYQNVISPITTNELIKRKNLVPLLFHAGREIDMTGAAAPAGEWTSKEVHRRGVVVIGDIVSEWFTRTHAAPEDGGFGGPVPTLVYSPDVEYGAKLVKAFGDAGFDFRQTSYKDNLSDTRELIAGFKRGDYMGLISVDKLAKGVDIPEVRCLVGARPYRTSLAAFLQQLGRGMRPSPGKEHCLYLDHSGNVEGWWGEIHDFWANGVRQLPTERTHVSVKRKEGAERQDIVCQCGLVMPLGARTCPLCGRTKPEPERKRPKRRVVTVPGSMRQVTEGVDWMSDRDWLWDEICTVVSRMTKDPEKQLKTAKFHFKTMTGDWPRWGIAFSPNPSGWPDKRVRLKVFEQMNKPREKQGEL